ncbi:MAG: DUF1559 domain-containing protein [Planctomycetales bacterium]|nr:DUF1559 domain-containing protein [Planctomycetales bacterium]
MTTAQGCPTTRFQCRPRRGMTLVELLVVIFIIAVLVGLLIPAIQNAREAARRTSCMSNLRQVGLSVQLYEGALNRLPPSFKTPGGAPLSQTPVDGWSTHVLLLPFLEQQVIQDRIDLNSSFDENFAPIVNVTEGEKPMSAVRVPIYLCPSEKRDEVRYEDGVPRHYPLNYGFNLGEWFVIDPQTGEGGNGAFYPNSELRTQDFVSLERTWMAAEVRAWQPYYRNASLPEKLEIPAEPNQLCQWAGAEFKEESGHTEWVDGRAHQAGFTTVFSPNTKVHCTIEGRDFDIDWTNQQEGKSPTVSTYAAVTARSYHPGIVNVVTMDGAVESIDENIDLQIWRGQSRRQR